MRKPILSHSLLSQPTSWQAIVQQKNRLGLVGTQPVISWLERRMPSPLLLFPLRLVVLLFAAEKANFLFQMG